MIYYGLSIEEANEIRSYTTERLHALSSKKDEMLEAMNKANKIVVMQHGKMFAATSKQIHERANQFIAVVNDELRIRGMQ